MLNLPKDFKDKYRDLLGAEQAEKMFTAMNESSKKAFRVNTLKNKTQISYSLDNPVPEIKHAYYGEISGEDPEWVSGYVYSQDPAAMFPAAISTVKPGEKVLDLCAAPGGKTTALGEQLKNKGLLVANEISISRAKILRENVERWGISNALVTNETPENLAAAFPDFFDVILVDAPCSGEGMFRKNPAAIDYWSQAYVLTCAQRQRMILAEAVKMLKPGGRLVYSTCTFAPEENEQAIGAFIESHPEFKIESMKAYEGFKPGRREWSNSEAEGIEETYRLWPHYIHGEGHYVAVLRKTENAEFKEPKRQYVKPLNDKKKIQEFLMFAKVALVEVPKGDYVLFGDQLYIVPEEMLTFDKLKVVRAGWHLGTMKKNRFEPSHALALSLSPQDVKHSISFAADSDEIRAYLRGETIPFEGEKGWYLICVDGYSLGWAKLANNMLKNHYPKGLRWN